MKLRKHWSIPLAAAVLAAASFGPASAQATCGATGATPSCSPAGVEVTTTVTSIVRVSVTPTSGALTAPTDADFAGGGSATITDLALQTATVQANNTWTVTINGGAWTAPWSKPIADLEWTDDGVTFTPMSTTPAALNGSGVATASEALTLGYRTSWDLLNDVPGTYTMPVTLNISAP